MSLSECMYHSSRSPLDYTANVSLERVPETGRLRFMDVNEAQEREVRPSLHHAREANTRWDIKLNYKH